MTDEPEYTLLDRVTDALQEADSASVTYEDMARVAIVTVLKNQPKGALGRATIEAMEEQLIARGWQGADARYVVAAVVPTLEAAGHGEGCLHTARADELLNLVESVMEERDRLQTRLVEAVNVVETVMNGIGGAVMKGLRQLLDAAGSKKEEQQNAGD